MPCASCAWSNLLQYNQIMARILIADDDPDIRELLVHFLSNQDFEVSAAPDGRAALDLVEQQPIDLAVIDIMMPGMDGWQLCREIKRRRDMPVLMLTAMGETSRKLRAFDLGADDYLVKPFDPVELGARIKLLLKRYRILAADILQIGQLTINKAAATVSFRGQDSNLPRREYELLWTLAAKTGSIFTRNQLIQAVWGDDFEGNERTVDVHINRLRERFPEADSGLRFVAIRGLGYRLELVS